MYKLLFLRLCEGGINLCDYSCNISTSFIQQLLNFHRPYTSIYCYFASFLCKEGTNMRFKIIVLLCKNRT